MITVKKQHLEYLARFVATEETRYYLMGVYFDKDKNTLVATDGHRLGYIEQAWEGELEESKIVKITKAALQLMKTTMKKFEIVNLEVTEKGLIMSDGEQQVLLPFIDSSYPDWRKISKVVTGSIAHFGINPKLLKDFQIKQPVVIVPQCSNLNAMVVLVDEIPEFRGLIMPVRISSKIENIINEGL